MKIVLLTFVTLVIIVMTNNIAYAQGVAFSPIPQNSKTKTSLRIHNSQQAAQLVKSRFGGKVLKVNRQKVNGHSGYKVKLIKKNGHVISVLVDAQSGRVIGG